MSFQRNHVPTTLFSSHPRQIIQVHLLSQITFIYPFFYSIQNEIEKRDFFRLFVYCVFVLVAKRVSQHVKHAFRTDDSHISAAKQKIPKQNQMNFYRYNNCIVCLSTVYTRAKHFFRQTFLFAHYE